MSDGSNANSCKEYSTSSLKDCCYFKKRQIHTNDNNNINNINKGAPNLILEGNKVPHVGVAALVHFQLPNLGL